MKKSLPKYFLTNVLFPPVEIPPLKLHACWTRRNNISRRQKHIHNNLVYLEISLQRVIANANMRVSSKHVKTCKREKSFQVSEKSWNLSISSLTRRKGSDGLTSFSLVSSSSTAAYLNIIPLPPTFEDFFVQDSSQFNSTSMHCYIDLRN